MNKYYRHELEKINPAEPVKIILTGMDSKTKTLNLNPESIRELRKLLVLIECGFEGNTLYKTAKDD